MSETVAMLIKINARMRRKNMKFCEIKFFFMLVNKSAAWQFFLSSGSFKGYSSEIASEGQDAAHEPQLIHDSASIVLTLPDSEIAPTGQSDSQAPQFTHFPESTL